MLTAANEEDYQTYIPWLAAYLFRPSEKLLESLSEEEARLELTKIEIEIADWMWTHQFEDYPPSNSLPRNGARHADILYRHAISETLYRVPDRAIRIELLNRFYAELNSDACK